MRLVSSRNLFFALAGLIALPWLLVSAQNSPTSENYFGAYSEEHLTVVEKYHLDPMYLHFAGNSHYVWDEIEFILSHFPNHPQALNVAAEYAIMNSEVPRAEAWFDRAVSMYPDVPQTYVLYGVFRHKQGRIEEAIKHYRIALDLDNELAEAHYNLGLALLNKGQLDRAANHASAAYRLDHPLPGLRKLLADRGILIDDAIADKEDE
jgi:tetratricopeptide (TPR) repeat protein